MLAVIFIIIVRITTVSIFQVDIGIFSITSSQQSDSTFYRLIRLDG